MKEIKMQLRNLGVKLKFDLHEHINKELYKELYNKLYSELNTELTEVLRIELKR
jgi:hypothetical protein